MNSKLYMKILTTFLTVLMLFNSLNVVSADEGLTVVRGGDTETFSDNLSIDDVNLFIDLEKINRNNLEYTSTIDGLKLVEGPLLDNTSMTTKVFVVERRNMSNNADGFNIDGNLVITYKDAFLAKDGTRSDLILTIDNIYTKNVASESVGDKVVYYGIFNVDGAYFTTMAYGENLEVIKYNATDEEVQSGLGIKGTSRTARRLNFSIGSSKNGKFVFGVRDLDVEEQITLRNADNNYTGEFVESIEINSGTDKIYVPETNFLDVVGTNIRATALDDSTWNSGFLSIFSTDNSFTWRAGGTNVNTSLFETLPFHKVEDSVIGGGEIKYVKSDVETDQGLIIAGGGDNVSIVTRPLEGHKIKKITVDGQDVTPEDKLSEYTYSFNDIHEDHEIIAEYEPFTYKINYDANGGEGDMPSQTFTFDDATFTSSENSFTKEGYDFVGFKLEGRDELITSPEDFRALLVAMGDGAEITLVAQWKEKKVQTTVKKLWEDIDGNPMEWPEDVESVEIIVEYGTEDKTEKETIILTAEQPKKQTSEFTYVEGAEFSATEKDIDGYDVGIYGSEDGITVVNTKNNIVPIHIDLISIAKYWDDNRNASGKRPESLQFIIKDSAGNVYNGTDEQKIGYLSSENLQSFDKSIELYTKHLEENKDKMSQEEIDEWNAQIASVTKMRDEAVEAYGTGEYWLNMWFIEYEGKESRTYTIEEPSVNGYTLVKSETDAKDGFHIATFVNKLKEDSVRTLWIDELGNSIIDPQKGEHPKKGFENYEFVNTEVLSDGTIVHRYHKLINLKFVVDGKTVKENKVRRGTDGVAPKNPEKNGYTFSGWDKTYTNLQADTVVNAKFTPIKYPVKYILNGGTNHRGNPSEYTIEEAYTIKEPTRSGYRFLGWKEGNSIAKGSTGEKVFTAQWEKIKDLVPTGSGMSAIYAFAGLSISSLLLLKRRKSK